MESPVKGTGWTGRMEAPRTIERKRKGRETDRIILPTPPRTQERSHLPTPETIRRPAKPTEKQTQEPTIQTMLPTPQTLPRPPRKNLVDPSSSTSAAEEEDIITPPSPSGHTTFYLSSNGASGSRGEKVSRRRPGLTFAQQMGLLPNGASSGGNARPGVGVGMGGGSRSGGHKKDQVVWGHLAAPVALDDDDENPFISRPSPSGSANRVAPPAPGRSTKHQPRREINDEDTKGVEPLVYLSTSPSHHTDPLTGLLTPPPTRTERGVRTIPKPKVDAAEEARRREKREQMKRMMDEESNPFLVKPGESSRSKGTRHAPIVDESQPTVTYVFRGAKKVFANPFYPANAPFPQSLLDPEDEDYEPHPNPKPRLLWPSPPANRKRTELNDEFESPSAASPPSSPIATPRRRLFARGGDVEMVSPDDEGDNNDEEGEDEEIAEVPTRRRLFVPAPTVKRPAESSNQPIREEKRLKGMRV